MPALQLRPTPLCCPVINFSTHAYSREGERATILPSSLSLRLSYFITIATYIYIYVHTYSSRSFYFLFYFPLYTFPFLLLFPPLLLFVFPVREIIMELLPHGHVEILLPGGGWLAIYVSETQKPVCPLSSPKSIYTYTYYVCARTILLLSELPRGRRNNVENNSKAHPRPKDAR